MSSGNVEKGVLSRFSFLPLDAYSIINQFIVGSISDLNLKLQRILSGTNDGDFILQLGHFLLKYKNFHMFSIKQGLFSIDHIEVGKKHNVTLKAQELVYRPVGYCLRWQTQIFERINRCNSTHNMLKKMQNDLDLEALLLFKKWFPSIESLCGINKDSIDNGMLKLNYHIPNNHFGLDISNTAPGFCLHGKKLNDLDVKLLSTELKSNTYIQTVWLTNNDITDVGAIEIATNVLPFNSTIETLNLYNNRISDAGGRAFANSFYTNNSIVHFDLIGNPISNDVYKQIEKAWNNRSRNLNLYVLKP